MLFPGNIDASAARRSSALPGAVALRSGCDLPAADPAGGSWGHAGGALRTRCGGRWNWASAASPQLFAGTVSAGAALPYPAAGLSRVGVRSGAARGVPTAASVGLEGVAPEPTRALALVAVSQASSGDYFSPQLPPIARLLSGGRAVRASASLGLPAPDGVDPLRPIRTAAGKQQDPAVFSFRLGGLPAGRVRFGHPRLFAWSLSWSAQTQVYRLPLYKLYRGALERKVGSTF